jgi:RNA polymerase sigma factor (sigma-70 family)
MRTDSSVTKATIEQRFLALLEEHAGILHKVASTYTRSAEDRRDLVQEITAQLWRAFPRYDPARKFSTWMYRIALNVAISALRSVSRRDRHFVPLGEMEPEAAAETGPDLESREQVRALRRVIDGLGELDRALLLLYLDELSYAEIASVLGISETNVATKLSRLKQRIRKDLTESPSR